MTLAVLLYAFGMGLFVQLLWVYALNLGSSRFMIGMLNAIMLATIAAGNIPGAWAARRFRLKPAIVVVWWLTVPAGLTLYLAPTWPWLIPGLVIFGLSFANSPAMKSYVYLKSEPSRVARNLTIVLGAIPLGLVVAPLVGGQAASHFGMRTVFLISTAFFVLSSVTITFIRDTHYHSAETPWSLRSLGHNRRFRRYLVFFLVGYLAAYVGQAFVNPYLSQVHDQGYAALGVYSSLAALGAVVLTLAMGRATDFYGPRVGIAGVLVFLLAGAFLLLVGRNPLVWALAMLFCGSFDALRFVAAGIVGDSFEGIPLAWGYGIFDAVMGLPMAGGAVLGGVLYRAGYALPFVLVIVVTAGLLVVLLAGGRSPAEENLADAGRDGP
ncbi:MAG: MFS transporter [Actinobacteria bacterium]|nr:MFS transporter [Actinomycetota bacterium]